MRALAGKGQSLGQLLRVYINFAETEITEEEHYQPPSLETVS